MEQHEVVIYQICPPISSPTVYLPVESVVPAVDSPPSIPLSLFLAKLAKISALIGIVLLALLYSPAIFSHFNFNLSTKEVANLSSESLPIKTKYEPAFNPRLPKDNHLIIPSIGVDTSLQEATYDNYEEALENGAWRVSDFGAPGDNISTIVAAHRFGYLAWTNIFRHQNSFFNLPKLKVGDTVEIDWHQRKYIYEVYAEEKGTEITDYSANLILYTCENLTGEERVFKYARLLEI